MATNPRVLFTLSRDAIRAINLKELEAHVTFSENSKYFDEEPGNEHYKLIAHLSDQCPDGVNVVDVGTYMGFSATALAHNSKVNVVTYDLVDHLSTVVAAGKKTCTTLPNVISKFKNILTHEGELKHIVDTAPLVVLDVDPHDGVQEVDIIRALIEHDYKGIVVCDDIHLNEPMENFWRWVPLKKIDVTQLGHWSGTGIIVFDEDVLDVNVVDSL